MYDAANPAPDVLELVEFLRREHREGDLFRGQQRDFPAVIPSAYRRSIVADTADQPLVRIDEKQFYASQSVPQKRRYAMMNHLIEVLGIGLGNLIAQQYGLSSECLDVTEDPLIAAFFATRPWPAYAHDADGEVGVIYRFRSGATDLHPPKLDFFTLSDWFERGASDRAYFDFFVSEEKRDRIFDRDKWYGPGQPEQVSTLPLTVRWSDLLAVVGNEREKKRDEQGVMRRVLDVDWRLTRVAQQRGGFIRPRITWDARVSTQVKLLHDPRDRRQTPRGMAVLDLGDFADDGFPWPRAYPSSAIKTKFVGVENLRHRDGFDVFYFRHTNVRVRGLYRRLLWPEPSEDPLYSILWDLAIVQLMRLGDSMPAVDDMEHGLLDRGYRLQAGVESRTARELDDLARGQFEDAAEAIDGQPTDRDWMIYSNSLLQSGQQREAIRTALAALRNYPESMSLLLAAFALLDHAGRYRLSRKLFERAAKIDPEHPEVLRVQALECLNAKDFAGASRYLRRALGNPDLALYDTPTYLFYEQAAFAGALSGDEDLQSKAVQWLKGYHPDYRFGLDRAIEDRKAAEGLGSSASGNEPFRERADE